MTQLKFLKYNKYLTFLLNIESVDCKYGGWEWQIVVNNCFEDTVMWSLVDSTVVIL